MYIGKDSKSDPKYLGSGTILKQAIKKYGKDNFVKIILEDNIIDNDILNDREIYYITLFQATNNKNFYNISTGGGGGDNFTNHPNKEGIRLKCIENWKAPIYTDELRKKLSDVQKKIIYKFDKIGSLICKYDSIEEAAIDNNIKNKGNICLVADGKRNYACNFRWSYTNIPMLLLNNKKGRKNGTLNTYKIVRNHANIKFNEILIFNENNEFLIKVIGYHEAATYTKLNYQMINKKCISGEFYKGFYFKKGNTINITKNIMKTNKENFTITEQGGSMKSGDKCSSPDKVVSPSKPIKTTKTSDKK